MLLLAPFGRSAAIKTVNFDIINSKPLKRILLFRLGLVDKEQISRRHNLKRKLSQQGKTHVNSKKKNILMHDTLW